MEKREPEERWAQLLERRRWTARDASWALQQWEASGGAVSRFARRHGIDPNRLLRWRARLEPRRRAAGESRQARVIPQTTLVPMAVRPSSRMEEARSAGDCAAVVSTGGVRIEVRELNATSRSWVAELLGLGCRS